MSHLGRQEKTSDLSALSINSVAPGSCQHSDILICPADKLQSTTSADRRMIGSFKSRFLHLPSLKCENVMEYYDAPCMHMSRLTW
jgi:hypothetical protein